MIRRNLKFIIILMSVTMVGLIILQFYWISKALKVQEDYFSQNVRRAMSEVVRKVERDAASRFISGNFQNLSSGYHQQKSIQFFSGRKGITGNLTIRSDSGKVKHSYKKVIVRPGQKGGSYIEVSDSSVGKHMNRMEEIFNNLFSSGSSVQMLRDMFVDFSGKNIHSVSDMEPSTLDSLIKTELNKSGINSSYDFAVINTFFQSLIMSKTNKHTEELFLSPYKIPLNSGGLFPSSEYLTLFFPAKNHYLYKQMSFVLASSAIFIFLIIFCFAYTIYTIYKQKKLSEMKSDFINNMTHEFKTPVSTILLASQALKESAITEDRERVNRLGNIIYEENNRIAGHVERVLQIAAMEKENFKLTKVLSDANELIKKVVENMQIQAEHKGGRITSNLNAINSKLMIDPAHFTNVISNLLDNAIKYTTQSPEVIISTKDADKEILITIEDNGIGLSSEQKNRIFEQFYRVPTGNIHDVKGFGLGLYYVKTIIQMHGGTIKVESEKNKGSIFEIVLSSEAIVHSS